jgi:hypothetical protein
LDEVEAMKQIAASTKEYETKTLARIETTIKTAETKQTESEAIMDALYKEILAT